MQTVSEHHITQADLSRWERVERDYLAQAPTPITAERFDEMLGALPPVAWRNAGGWEYFLMSEFLCGDVTEQFARIRHRGEDHFFTKPVLAHDRSTWLAPHQLQEIIDRDEDLTDDDSALTA